MTIDIGDQGRWINHSTQPCRGVNCTTQLPPREMVPANKVLKPNARGWFCRPCAIARGWRPRAQAGKVEL